MNTLPFTFRDFIIYFIPGSIFIFDIILLGHLSNFWDQQNLPIFTSKNQSIYTMLFISVSYIIGTLISNEIIFEKIIKIFKLSYIFKYIHLNIDGKLENSLKKYHNPNEKFFYTIIENIIKENTLENLNNNLIWLTIKKISIDDKSLSNKNDIERINALRNLVIQLTRTFTLIILINILIIYALTYKSIILSILYLSHNTQIDCIQSTLITLTTISTHFSIIFILLYLSNIKIPKISDWLIRTVLLSHYVINEKK